MKWKVFRKQQESLVSPYKSNVHFKVSQDYLWCIKVSLIAVGLEKHRKDEAATEG